MYAIFSSILSFINYVQQLHGEIERYKHKKCPYCGKSHIWLHGFYERKVHYTNVDEPSDPILIPRFICQNCKKTHSVLPAFLPAHRWYVWKAIQNVIEAFISGLSCNENSKANQISRSTCSRWWERLREQFLEHSQVLRQHFSELGRCDKFREFWDACLNKMPMATAMDICHCSGVVIP